MIDMARLRLSELAERAARAATDETGYFESKDHEDRLVGLLASVRLTPQSEDLLRRQTAKKLCEQLVRNRHPRRRNVESAVPVLYNDGYILVLPSKRRVWMAKATRTDLIEWLEMGKERVAREGRSFGDRERYVENRLSVWRDFEDIKTLGELERHSFAYRDGTVIEDDLGDEEEE